MSRGKKKRQRRKATEVKKLAGHLDAVNTAAGHDQHEPVVEPGAALPPAPPVKRAAPAPPTNPYVWEGNTLVCNRGTFGRHVVAKAEDFPQLRRADELNDRANEWRRKGMMGAELFPAPKLVTP